MNEASLPRKASVESLVARVADEFVERQKSGEKPDIEEYAARYPDAADLLRNVLVALKLIGRSQLGGAGISETTAGPSGTLGDFRIVREVGRGGMGVVYEAEQISLRRRVALKVLPFAATMDPRHLQRFHNEAQAAASLQHANIVPVYFVGCERGVHFYAMQFIDGQSLEGFLRQLQHAGNAAKTTAAAPTKNGEDVGPISISPDAVTMVESWVKATTQPAPQDAAYFRRVAEWGIAVAEALEHAHSLGIVHRDIKPGNLLLDGTDRLWVTDFGLARTVHDAGLTLTGDLLGTLRYMSPEQALAKHGLVDHRTDIYSLGVTLFELLTLRPAINGMDREEILKKIAFEEPPGARQLNGAIPAELETIVRKAMSKEPAERYTTAKELADDLHRFLDDKPIRARPPSLCQRMKKWARRHTAVIWTAAIVLLVATAVLAAGAIWHLREVQTTLAEVRQREREVRQLLNVSNLRLEHQFAWKNGDVRQLRAYLDKHPFGLGDSADERCFAWYYLNRLVHGGEERTLRGHKGSVNALAFAADGRTLATAGQDGAVYLWDVARRQSRLILYGHTGAVRSLAFSPDGHTLATAGEDQLVKLWDADAGWERITLPPFARAVVSVVFSADGRWLVAGDQDGKVRIWDFSLGNSIDGSPRNPFPFHTLCSRDGRVLGFGEIVALWTPQQQYNSFFLPPQQYYGGAWSYDGSLAAAGGLDGSVKLRHMRTGAIQVLRGHTGTVRSLAFSADDRWLVSGGEDATVRIWDLREGKQYKCFRGHLDIVCGVAFAPRGNLVASASADGTVKLWRLNEQPEYRELDPALRLAGPIALSPDGTSVAAAVPHGAVQLLDTASWQERRRLEGHSGDIRALAFAPDGKTLATAGGDRAIRFWDVVSGQQQSLFRDPARRAGHLIYSCSGRLLAVGEKGTECELWDVTTGHSSFAIPAAPQRIAAVDSAADGKILATASGRNVQLWDAATGRQRARLELRSPVSCVALDRQGRMLAAGLEDGGVFLWDVTKPASQAMNVEGAWYWEPIKCLSFSPDGNLLVAGAGSSLIVFDVAGRRRRHLISTSSDKNVDPIAAVVFAANNRSVICTSQGGRLKRFDLGGRLVHMPAGQPMGGVCALTFVADGRTLLTASTDTHALFSFYPAGLLKSLSSLGGGNWQTHSLVLGNTREALRLWEVTSGRQQGELPLHPLMTLHALAASGDGRIVAGAFLGDGVAIWEVENRRERCRLFLRSEGSAYWDLCAAGLNVMPLVPIFRTELTALALSQDGRLLATASKDKPLTLWDTIKGVVVRTLGGPCSRVTALAFSPDGSLLAAAQGGRIDLWDLVGGQRYATLTGHRDGVHSLAFAPRGGMLASGGQDGRIRLWDVRTGAERALLMGHMGRVAALAFAPDERTLASGSWDGTVKLWHLETAKELLSLEGHRGNVCCVAFSPDGQTLASGGEAPNGKGQVCLWDAAMPAPPQEQVPAQRKDDGPR